MVAQQVHSRASILGAWIAGGAVALAGALVYAELAARRPEVGGQYAYLRDAFHPSVAFVYGWTLLLVTQTGGMAAVAVTFARYFLEITRAPVSDAMIAAAALAALTIVNCLGVRAGSNVQSALMILKILAIGVLVGAGILLAHPAAAVAHASDSSDVARSFGAAMTPVLFAYGGWQTSELCRRRNETLGPRSAARAGVGVAGVIVLYVAVAFVCVYALGPRDWPRLAPRRRR